MPPLGSLLRRPPPAPETGPRPQGPLTMTDKLMTLAQGLLGVNSPDPTDFQTPEDFKQADRWHGLGELASLAPALAAPMMALKAYHGSPHDFDAFSLSKIGSGEGGQAYGHGLYFAENPAVAAEYRKNLAKGEQLTIRPPNAKPITGDAIDDVGLDAAKFLEIGQQQAGQFPHNRAYYAKKAAEQAAQGLPGAQARHQAVMERIEQWKDAKIGYEPIKGATYEVNIHASPDELLDWDKPLSQQPPKVQEALKASGLKLPDSATGQQIHDAVTARAISDAPPELRGTVAAKPSAAEKLKELGIKGIQYLDQGSRITAGVNKFGDNWFFKGSSTPYKTQAEAEKAAEVAGNVTRNFVIFDDKIIEIAKKYGLSLPVAASLYKWQQSQQSKKGVE